MNSRGAGVVCVGLCTLDVIHRVPEPLRFGRKGVAESTELAAGGPCANAAIACAAQGVAVSLVSALGNGPAAGVARADLLAHGVQVLDVAPDWDLPVASCVVHADGERTVVSPGARASTVLMNDAALAAVRAAGVLLLDGHHPELAEQALANAPGAVVVLDAGSVKPRAEQWLPRVDILAASADYADGLGLDHPGAATHALSAGAQVAVITDGAGPVRWWSADGSTGSVRPPSVVARDTLGAGDAFHGALVAAIAGYGDRWRDQLAAAVEFASAQASRRVAHAGARAWLQA